MCSSSVVRMEMIKECWKLILISLAAGMQSCTEERFVQNILRSYQSIVGTAGALEMKDVRGGFMDSLCQLALPLNITSVSNFSTTNVQVRYYIYITAININMAVEYLWQ